MFDDITCAEANKDSIMGVMRSTVVCLHILLKNESITEKLNKLPKSIKDKDLNVKPAIIDNINDILFEESLNDFRQEFVQSLHDAGMEEEVSVFTERLEIARSLPIDTKNQTKKIMNTLLAGKQWFVNWLGSLIEHEHDYTQEAGISLICDHVSPTTSSQSNNQSANPSVNYYDNETVHHQHHHHHHRDIEQKSYYYLLGNCQPGQETAEELEKFNQRIKVNQCFKKGIRDVEGNIWRFKDPNDLFSLEETDEVLSKVLSFSAGCPASATTKVAFVIDETKLNTTKAKEKVTKATLHV